MVLYESHLGGLYTTDEPLSWEETYCEECGDSDREMGAFEDAEGLWRLAKPAKIACIGCEKERDCFFDCDEVDADGTDLPLSMVMRKVEDYAVPGEGTTVVLAVKDAKSGGFFAFFRKGGKREFGEILRLPSCFCLKPELEAKVALSIVPFLVDVKGTPEKVAEARTRKDGRKVVAYLAKTREPSEEEFSDENAVWMDQDEWIGIVSLEELAEKGDDVTAAVAKALIEKTNVGG